ncbi:MarR family transcriptional regulator [Tsukamurella soli]|uniref:MarR family transcriptional regulator n=1 Tax=Tsukamurella soli TaxID=644556 RepID=A0ABP8J0Y5_9ACTN
MPPSPDVDDVAAALYSSIGLCLRVLRLSRGEGAPSLSEVSALKRLDRGGATTVTALAAAEQISVQSMGATLGALETRGLVHRDRDPDDGRRSVLSITPAGRRVLEDKQNARTQQLARALSGDFSPVELDQLMTAAPLIERMARRL